jgi:hypothetical protein
MLLLLIEAARGRRGAIPSGWFTPAPRLLGGLAWCLPRALGDPFCLLAVAGAGNGPKGSLISKRDPNDFEHGIGGLRALRLNGDLESLGLLLDKQVA